MAPRGAARDNTAMNDDPLYREALARFHEAFERARAAGIREPEAMTLASADGDGRPSARVMLLKGADARGFVFYTNQDSRKGEQIAANPWVALCLYWPELMEQVRIEGRAEPVSAAEADAYWKTRPRRSQIGAWASRQSRPGGGPRALEERIRAVERRFDGQPVPRPPYWSGYRVRPEWIEFWQGGAYEHRIHRRQCYRLAGEGWVREELDP